MRLCQTLGMLQPIVAVSVPLYFIILSTGLPLLNHVLNAQADLFLNVRAWAEDAERLQSGIVKSCSLMFWISNINKHSSGAGPCVPKSHFVGSPAHKHVSHGHVPLGHSPDSRRLPRLSKLLYSSHEVDTKSLLQVQQHCVGLTEQSKIHLAMAQN